MPNVPDPTHHDVLSNLAAILEKRCAKAERQAEDAMASADDADFERYMGKRHAYADAAFLLRSELRRLEQP